MKKVFKLSAAVVACSERTKNVAIDFGANAANSHVLFTINLANLGPIQKDIARKKINLNDGKILLTVGRLVERKGHDMVLKSLPKIIKKFPNVKYIIGGEGPYKHRLQELIQELDLNKSVIFLGHISDDELPYYYSAADIFISPNRELPSGEIEGLGIVFLEAAACGTTSIAGKSGGTESAVIHKKTGLLVDPHNVNEITTAMTSLLDDCKLRETMEEAGLKRVNDIGNIDLLIKSVEQMHLKF
ncbi:MAG: glycosyltransferase family 4 protein [Candidatus Lindowbacteria bacterium]|nr:glycosyltransferase family 4 protein [Candidatus Lindowbacteria bacterium]